jgi:hypothetical protein
MAGDSSETESSPSKQPASDSMSAPVAPRGGVFRCAGFQAQNVLPVFAIHTYRTDDVLRNVDH